MLFTGHSEHSIDGKLRLAVPAKYRNLWDPARDGGAWYCIPWPSGHLRLYTEGRFKEMAERGDNTLTPAEEEAGLEAALYGFAERLEMDANGRISIPKSHLEKTGLKSDVVIVGARVRLEVHDRDEWNSTENDRFQRLPELIAKLQARKSQHD